MPYAISVRDFNITPSVGAAGRIVQGQNFRHIIALMESMLPPSVSKGRFKVTDKVLEMINPKSQ